MLIGLYFYSLCVKDRIIYLRIRDFFNIGKRLIK